MSSSVSRDGKARPVLRLPGPGNRQGRKVVVDQPSPRAVRKLFDKLGAITALEYQRAFHGGDFK